MSNPENTLDRCFEIAAQTMEKRTGQRMSGRRAVAEICGITRRAPYKWTRIPPERCIALEEAFQGRMTRYEMRPDVFGDAK